MICRLLHPTQSHVGSYVSGFIYKNSKSVDILKYSAFRKGMKTGVLVNFLIRRYQLSYCAKEQFV